MWKYSAIVLGLAVVAGGLWAWSERDATSVPNQEALEAALEATVDSLVLPDGDMSVQQSTCLKPFDACRPSVTAIYRLVTFDEACAAVQQAAERLEVTARDDEACWAAGHVLGRDVVVAVGNAVDTNDGVPFTVVVI